MSSFYLDLLPGTALVSQHFEEGVYLLVKKDGPSLTWINLMTGLCGRYNDYEGKIVDERRLSILRFTTESNDA